jgi:hypothetical protein
MQTFNILPFLKDRAFDADITKALGEAFDRACAGLGDSAQSELIKEVMAKRIIAAASAGERDPHRLCERALHGLGSNH